MGKKMEPQDARIKEILQGDPDEVEFDEGLRRFYEHLRKNLQLPCEVTGIEDFEWEEFYVIGPGDKEEYRQLKKTQPSFKDLYDLLAIDLDADSEWMLYLGEDLGARVRRRSDRKVFCLGLAELKATERKSKNFELLDDYAVWFANYR
jgi:hypothetical protein